MLIQWANRYSQAASNSKRISQFGAFIVLIIALIEAFVLFRGAWAAENLSWESVINGAVPIGIFVFTFGIRFVVLISLSDRLLVRAITWWLIVVSVYLSLEFYGPEPGVIYSLFHSFPLEVSGSFFIIVGILRFLYFARVAFRNDFDTNS